MLCVLNNDHESNIQMKTLWLRNYQTWSRLGNTNMYFWVLLKTVNEKEIYFAADTTF